MYHIGDSHACTCVHAGHHEDAMILVRLRSAHWILPNFMRKKKKQHVLAEFVFIYSYVGALENPEFYELSCETLAIGYVKTFTENQYRLLTEIFIVENFRELGLGTFILNSIRKIVKNEKIPLRTVTLPSDRIAKNFYEASGITARALLMEEKRDKPRFRS